MAVTWERIGSEAPAAPLLVAFAGGSTGSWRVERIETVRGAGLQGVDRLGVYEGPEVSIASEPEWLLRGVTSNVRYTSRTEAEALAAVQPPLGRAEATCAALIPVHKSNRWWNLAQDERRAVFEEQSRHISTGLRYLPGVARRLHHCRDLGEPFDFLTWFEYAPGNAANFERLVQQLRATDEWAFVEREVDIRLSRNGLM